MPTPSPAQVAFARDLGIEEPEALDREELRWKIKDAQERRDAARVHLKLVAPRHAAAAPETPSRASEKKAKTVEERANDNGFILAMSERFEAERKRGVELRTALVRTLVLFDAHEVLHELYPANIKAAIRDTSWGANGETAWGFING